MSPSDIRFHGLWHGRKIFRVSREGRALFTGTRSECNRFLSLHEEKVLREKKTMENPRRRGPVYVRSYRVATRRPIHV